MARIRTLKPEFFRSRSLAKVSRDARLTFQGLWCEADDAGRGIADGRILKGTIWPLEDDITPEVVEGHLSELERTGHVRFYEVDGDRYYLVLSFEVHQAAAYRRAQPIYPEPPAHGDVHAAHVGVQLPQEPLTDKRVHGACGDVQPAHGDVLERGREGNEEGNEEGAAVPARRKRDFLWEAVLSECGVNQDELTPKTRGKHNEAVGMIRAAGGTPEEVPIRYRVYCEMFPRAARTTIALANHWAECDPTLQRNGNGQGLKNDAAFRRALARGGPT